MPFAGNRVRTPPAASYLSVEESMIVVSVVLGSFLDLGLVKPNGVARMLY
jgi:hypothetical protein